MQLRSTGGDQPTDEQWWQLRWLDEEQITEPVGIVLKPPMVPDRAEQATLQLGQPTMSCTGSDWLDIVKVGPRKITWHSEPLATLLGDFRLSSGTNELSLASLRSRFLHVQTGPQQ